MLDGNNHTEFTINGQSLFTNWGRQSGKIAHHRFDAAHTGRGALFLEDFKAAQLQSHLEEKSKGVVQLDPGFAERPQSFMPCSIV